MEVEESVLSFEDTEVAFSNKSNFELRQAYWMFRAFDSSLLTMVGTRITQLAFQFHMPIKPFVKETFFKLFCGGETLRETEKSIKELSKYNIKTVLEYGVETKSSERDYYDTASEMVTAIDYAVGHNDVKVISCKVTGLGRFSLFEKIHRGEKLKLEEEKELERVRDRMDKICHAASQAGVSIFFDAEETWIQLPLDMLITEMMARYNKEQAIVFNTYQLYRTDRLDYLKSAYEEARQKGYLLGAKLVRGAYMEKERERAKSKGYPSPIHRNKQAVDIDYNRALEFCLDNIDHLAFCAATHNEESCLFLANQIIERGIDRSHPHVFFSQLYGMGENITYNLAKEGFEATKLIPYGPVKEVIPYLIRRAEENSSVAGQVNRELELLKREMKRRKLW